MRAALRFLAGAFEFVGWMVFAYVAGTLAGNWMVNW